MEECNRYTVGWICAITAEYVAAKAFLDEEHKNVEYVSTNDNNIYTLGEVGRHNVVITRLPRGDYGIAAAASIARDMVHTFPNIRIGLMVGVGGGAPSKKHDIRLGDVVVSAPHGGHGGLFQYDFGKTIQNQKFHITGFLNQPPSLLRAAIGDIEAAYEMEGHQLDNAINIVLEKWPKLRRSYRKPDSNKDQLYQPHIVHPWNDESACSEAGCGHDKMSLVIRPERSDEDNNLAIHYGLIASANQVMKDSLIRDRLAAEKDVLCFEMEAAGLMNHFPCLVIRGICDYSDSHKNKEWQGYAAMVAAAYARDILSRILPNKIEAEKRICDLLSSMEENVKDIRNSIRETNSKIQSLDSDRRRDKIIAKLPYAKSSSFDSSDASIDSRCHPETRIDLRHKIRIWAEDSHGKSIFWLKGMAGTGKSTISRTVAEAFMHDGKLGASFFFKRGESDRNSINKFFTTICAQLLIKIPALTPHVEMAIDADPYISGKSMGEQFEKLICQPLSQVRLQSRLVVVVDALDECAQDGDTLLRLLSQTKNKWSQNLQILVTSRPEMPIRLGFKNMPENIHEDVALHEIPQLIIKQDIATFLEYKFKTIRETYNADDRQLPSGWPGPKMISNLVDMAVPLFIFAATLCRFIEDHRWSDPIGQFEKILEGQERSGESEIDKLDATYAPVLSQLITGCTKVAQKRLVDRFRKVVGPIVLLDEPLSRSSLASLLDMDSREIESQLASLYSVLSVPFSADSPIRMLHLSFREFLVDPDKFNTNPFWINEIETHKMLLMKCIERMSRSDGLRQNICSLDNYGILRTAIDSKQIADCISPDLQYACRYWISHLEQGRMHISDMDKVHVFLQRHFLHWLESLSILGRIPEGIDFVRRLQDRVDYHCSEVFDFIQDAMRFLLQYSFIIDRAPLQLYSSALVFAPKNSVVKNMFRDSIPCWIKELPEVESAWGAVLKTLEGHFGPVNAVAFSSNGVILASGSNDYTIRIWDTNTGALQQTLDGHLDRVLTVTFSADGKLLVSSSYDGIIKLWDPSTGTLKQTLEGHSNPVRAVRFCLDGRLLASASTDSTVKVWDLSSGGILQQTFEGHSDKTQAVALSPDCSLLASGSHNNAIKLWDLASGGSLKQITRSQHAPISSLAFSPDSKLLASGSHHGEVNIWDSATGLLHQTISPQALENNLGPVMGLAFSSDGKLLASSTWGRTVMLWDLASGGVLQKTLKGHTTAIFALDQSLDGKLFASGSVDGTVKLWTTALDSTLQQNHENQYGRVQVAAFSPDGKFLASGANDSMVRFWNSDTGLLQQTLEGHSSSVLAVAFSPDGSLLATSSGDQTIKLWNPSTGILQHTLEGHSGEICTIAFSLDGKLLASACSGGIVKLWDPIMKILQRTFESHPGGISQVAFSSTGKILASSTFDGYIELSEVTTGIIQFALGRHPMRITAIAFSPDDKLLASGSEDGTISVWNTTTGFLQHTMELQSGPVRKVAFSSDGKLLETYQGRFNMESLEPSRGSAIPDRPHSIHVRSEWVTRNDINVIWLPIEYRQCLAIHENTLALGHISGRVAILRIDNFPRL